MDLNNAVEGMLKMLRRLLGETVRLEWVPTEFRASVFIDALQLNQILTNLCLNARDAIVGPGIITITTDRVCYDEAYCTAHPDFLPGDFVLLSVADNGCGMNTETLDHLFEPFFTTKEIGKGSGLGLATVYGVVTQNEGFINVESYPGRGSNFRVYLPCHPGKEVPRPDRDVVRARVPSTEGGTILLVEDEPAILKLTTMMLKGLGHTVIAVGSPSKAIQIATEFEGRFDLLITDVVMPEMNGRDLAQRISTIHSGIKCLFMSGYTSDVIYSHGVQEGVYFLQKPFSMKDMEEKVRDALFSDKDQCGK